MKRLLTLTIVCVLLATNTLPVMAGKVENTLNGNKTLTKGKQLYALAGYITAIGTNQVTIRVATGNRLADDYVGSTLVIHTTLNTRLLLSGGTPITFSYFELDQTVSSNGIVLDGVWTANRITVGALLASK